MTLAPVIDINRSRQVRRLARYAYDVAKRTCKETTKAGKPCPRAPLTGHDVCLAHAPKDVREAHGFVAKNGKQGRHKRTVELMRAWVEDHPETFDVLKGALQATKPVVLSRGGNTSQAETWVEYVPDWPTRIVAFREILDRAYGRPKQAIEATIITQDEIDRAIRELSEQLAANDPDRPEGAAGEDPAIRTPTGATS